MGVWFQEEVEDVPDHVRKICEGILVDYGFRDCEVTVEPACPKGQNYCSVVLRLTAKSGHDTKSIITKMPLVQEYFKILSGAPKLFANETVIYNEFMPKIDELQDYAGIQEAERFGHATYLGSAVEPTEVILLEDLKESGYRNVEANDDYNNDEILLALKEMGKLHALSFVIKSKDEEFYDYIKNKLVNLWDADCNTAAVTTYFNVLERGTTVYFTDEDQKSFLKDSILNICDVSLLKHRAELNSKYSAIIICNIWRNKPMYKFEEGKPVKVKLLDFQQARVGSPASDVQFYLFNSISYSTRKRYYKDWIDYYYKNFEEFLNKFNIEAENVYPRTEFDKDLHREAKMTFGISVLFASFFAREEEVLIQTNKHDREMTQTPAQKYREKVEGWMKTVVDLGYIEK